VDKPAAVVKNALPKGLRRLARNELVNHGDFVADEQRGLEPWDGPSGFRADAFVKPIYRMIHPVRTRPEHADEKVKVI